MSSGANYTHVITLAATTTELATPVARAAAASAASHRHLGTVVETGLAELTGSDALDGIAVAVPDSGVAECFPADHQDLMALRAPLRGLFAAGWSLVVLVHARRMGDAHRSLRGAPVTIQPWWQDTPGSVSFGGPEVP